MRQDKVLLDIYHEMRPIVSIFAVDLSEVSDFTRSYELCDPSTLMMYYQRKHVVIGQIILANDAVFSLVFRGWSWKKQQDQLGD